MARKITSRLKIAGKLVAETPLHVGGYGGSPDTDLPLARNGKGEWYVPGTSIAGVLRNWCCQNFRHITIQHNKLLIEDVFGFQDGDQGQASFVLIEDATIENVEEALAEIRDGVGIDRFYGVAADKAKYDRAILPRGTELDFQMTVEIASRRDDEPENKEQPKDDIYFQRIAKTKAVVGHLLNALTESNVRFGAAKTRGLGRMKLENPSIKEQSFIGFEILNTLNGYGHPLTIKELKKADESTEPDSSPRLEIKIEWHPRLPVMVKAGYDGIGVDMLPLTSGVRDDELALCLPGSSIKGVLRSHAERIMRTLLDCKDEKKELRTKNKPNFHDQIDSIPLVEELFGARSKTKDSKNSNPSAKNKDKTNPQAKPGLSALAIDDCYAKRRMKRDSWQRVERATANPLQSSEKWELRNLIDPALNHPDGVSSSKYEISHHVAIDRWTGGASEGALFSVLAPHGVEWEEMRLTLDLTRIPENKRLACVSLLLFVLRDLIQDRIPLGFATNRGMGEIEVSDASFNGEISDDVLSEIVKVTLQGKTIVIPEKLKGELGKSWKETIEHYRNQPLLQPRGENMSEKQRDEEQETLIDKQEALIDGKETPIGEKETLTDVVKTQRDDEKETLQMPDESKYFANNKRDPYRRTGDIYIGRYVLEGYAGRGGMGAVYRAKDIQKSEQVAVKIIRPELVDENPDLLNLFRREVILTKQLSHPNIVKVLEDGEAEDGTTFMVMQWLEGTTLQKVIKGAELAKGRIKKIFRQVCLGIAAAHNQRILHLDIKPLNVFWFSDDDVKVIDFGLARVIESESGITVTQLAGTMEFCSPEHFMRNRRFTRRSDIYSLGVTLYNMCSGNLDPFDDNYIEAKKVSELPLPPIPSLKQNHLDLAAVDPIIEKALRKNPEERYQSVEELLREFEEALPADSNGEGEEQE